ncbi:MAG: pyruvate dehydrogenase complex dihydrolipoamide acetyltransferase [Proteobacteria bacterium]|nr:pyruvate dehydrogenase complex dihydrolipoamide acetyltransferase [Pseudomonadota bacterium]
MPISVLMPALSPTMTEGTLAKWLLKEGDRVESGDAIAEIETDKATMEIEAIDEGTLARILIPEGTEGVAVNTPIALILEDGEDASALDAAPTGAPVPTPGAPTPDAAPATAPAPRPEPATAPAPRVFASPLARRMAALEGLDLARVPGTGPHGRIVKADIEAALAAGTGKALAAAPVAPALAVAPAAPAQAPELSGLPGYTAIPNSSMRKTVARRLTESMREVPHFYLTIDCQLDKLLDLRKELNARSPEDGDGAYSISVNDFVIKASALALMRVPEANATWTDDAILRFERADISVAVAVEGGLITPIIRGADSKGLLDISQEMKALAGKARDGKLMPEEYQGGTFSVSNLGMFGIKHFTAIINPPQGCILAVGAGSPRAVVRDGALAMATVMSCTLSVDHRVVDGAVGAHFLAAFKPFIEDPVTMLL